MIARSATARCIEPDAAVFTAEVFDSFEGAGVGREEWDQFVGRVGGDLYVTYDWCRIWWRHYGDGRSLRVYAFRHGGGLVGVAPMCIEYVRLGPIKLKIAKKVGADSALTIFSLPLEASFAEAAYREIIDTLIEHEHCDAVWFGFTPGDDPTLGGLRDACAAQQLSAALMRDAAAGVQTFFRLPARFDAYLATLDTRQRQNYKRRLKLLMKSAGVVSDTVTDEAEAEQAFTEFRSQHDRQWQSEGKLGHFGDWPRSVPFNVELVRTLSRLGRLRIHRLIAGGKIIAFQYAFVFGDCCYWRLTARALEKDLERFGLGVLGLVQLIEAMTKEGVRRIEGGVGHYDYKMRFGAEEVEFRSLLVVSTRQSATLRTRVFLKLSDLLHLLYYRVWFLRLSPHVPWLRRPLWRLWVRSRL